MWNICKYSFFLCSTFTHSLKILSKNINIKYVLLLNQTKPHENLQVCDGNEFLEKWLSKRIQINFKICIISSILRIFYLLLKWCDFIWNLKPAKYIYQTETITHVTAEWNSFKHFWSVCWMRKKVIKNQLESWEWVLFAPILLH